ncbi:MAG: hypothetical protein L0Y76_03205 [Ignavibacteria bacterium]|nr:hypothetical protein [Ignavibacteria bacterium]
MLKNKIAGYIMSVIGFLLILYSAVNYILGLHLTTPSVAIGIVFVAVGATIIKKSRQPSEIKTPNN